ncbi:MAG: glycosyltransferase, partial [Solirubrobacterales bacterium]
FSYEAIAGQVAAMHAGYDTAGIDPGAPDALRALAAAGDAPIVLYVGKLIVSKGVDLLLTAWPLVRQKHPNAQLAITGFGAYREGLEMLLMALSDRDLETVRWIAAGGRAFEAGPAGRLAYVLAFLDGLSEADRAAYADAAAGMTDSVRWFGRLEHDVLPELVQCADAQVVPSTFPEAFGMVAAEAAACGVPPLCANHSGLAEVIVELEKNLSGASGALLSFRLSDGCVEQMAGRINRLIGLERIARADLSARLSDTARGRFSWDGVASGVAAAAVGAHASLRQP